MSVNNHLKQLQDLHAQINKRIDTMEKTGVFDDLTLEVLKKQRLHLKDEIAKINNQQISQ